MSGTVVALPGSVRFSRRVAAVAPSAAPPPASPPAAPQAPPPSAPRSPVAVNEFDDRIVLSNAVGDWSVWKQVTWSADGLRVVGPGYIGRLQRGGGLSAMVDDFRVPGTINDPRFGGLGAFGWQHARAGRGVWDVDGRLDAVRNGGFGVARSAVVEPPAVSADGTGSVAVRVEFRDGWQDPVLAITYRYLVEPQVVVCLVEVEQLWQEDGQGQAFVKEPKLVAAVRPVYPVVEVYRSGEELLRRIELRNLSEPWFETAQIAMPSREGVAFVGQTSPSFSISMQSWNGEQVLPWCGSGFGFDGWAEAAQRRPALSGLGPPYCLAGGARLRRRWEVAARTNDPAVSCLFHGWEGGSGLTDCLDASRAFGPAGESWSVIATYRL